jgi:hypothetical protein
MEGHQFFQSNKCVLPWQKQLCTVAHGGSDSQAIGLSFISFKILWAFFISLNETWAWNVVNIGLFIICWELFELILYWGLHKIRIYVDICL